MTSNNLANVYAFLLKKCPEPMTVTFSQPSSYLCEFVGATNRRHAQQRKVVFVYEDSRVAVEKFTPEKPQSLQRDIPDLDLTGSPLKDDCAVDGLTDLLADTNLIGSSPWRLEEECHKGIPIEKARALINDEEFQCGPETAGAKGPVWLLCNGQDPQKTLLLLYEFDKEFFSRGIVTFNGILPVQSVASIQPMLDLHYATGRFGSTLETFIENVYQIKDDVKIRCSWSTTVPKASLIDLSTCDVVLFQKFKANDCSHLSQDLMNQLRILTCIREDIVAYKENESDNSGKEPVYNFGSGVDMDELRETINTIFTDMSELSELDTYDDVEYDIEAIVRKAQLRNHTDLTDKLWGVLRECASYKDLKLAFNVLFQCAVRCNIVNTPTNKNRLAEIISEISNHRLAIPCLTGSEPLELLLEIGMEKLHKDYEYIFTEGKICSAKLLEDNGLAEGDLENLENNLPATRKSMATPRKTLLHKAKGPSKSNSADIVGFKNSNFDENATARRLAKLWQIHCTLEHLLKVQINLNLNNAFGDVCEQLLKKPIQPLTRAIDESFVDDMQISLSARVALSLLENKDPFSRHITLKSQNKFRRMQTTFFYSMENICPPKVSECFKCEDQVIAKENVYYCWLYRCIQNLR